MDTSAAIKGATVPVGAWAIVPRNSTAAFAVRNFGVKTVRGIIPIKDATVVISDPQRISAVHATLDLAGIDTANSKRDKDLRARHLLDTEQFPDLVFDTATVTATQDGWQLTGTLAARGTSTPISVDAVLVDGPTAGLLTVRATATLDRRALGIRAPRLIIGRDVRIEVTAQFRVG